MKVIVLMAQTVDGRIALDDAHFPNWTESADKKFFAEISQEIGVMIMGRKTFDTLPGLLPNRLHIVMSRQAKEWEKKNENLIYTSLSPKKILEKLANKSENKDESSASENRVLVIGGEIINTLFARENLVDELILTISPKIFGEGLGVFSREISLDLELTKTETIGSQTVVLYYTIKK